MHMQLPVGNAEDFIHGFNLAAFSSLLLCLFRREYIPKWGKKYFEYHTVALKRQSTIFHHRYFLTGTCTAKTFTQELVEKSNILRQPPAADRVGLPTLPMLACMWSLH